MRTGECPRCRKTFQKKVHNQIFCNDCIQEGKNKKVKYIKCHSCGEVIETKTNNHESICIKCKRKTMEQYVCPKCKKVFYKKNPFQIFCSECIEEGKVGGYCYHICHRCGEPFKVRLRADGKQSYESVCYECKEKRKAEAAAARKEIANTYIKMKKRRCHDCGVPTYNYRCEKCRQKWCRLHQVSENVEFETYHVGIE